MKKKILVLGGTGLLGYHTTLELLKHDYDVVSISLPPMPTEDLFEGLNVESHLFDIKDKTDEELMGYLQGIYGVMYAIGADERVVPDAPAFSFFYEANVRPTQRLVRLARKSGVERFVVYGSYFSEFAQRWPETHLADQAYPKTRLLQEAIAFAEGEGAMVVNSLRLPYIFGTIPGRMPLWKMFTDQIKGQEVFPALQGGTTMVTVKQVAQAARGALERGEHRKTYTLGGINMKYQAFYPEIALNRLHQEPGSSPGMGSIQHVLGRIVLLIGGVGVIGDADIDGPHQGGQVEGLGLMVDGQEHHGIGTAVTVRISGIRANDEDIGNLLIL